MDGWNMLKSYLAGILREWQELRLVDLAYRHRDVALIVAIVLVGLPAFCAAVRLLLGPRPGREAVLLPAIVGLSRRPRHAIARHGPVLLFLAGLPLFVFALTDPYTSLLQQEVAFPGRRIAVMIDASSSMMAKFPAGRLAKNQEVQNTFFTTVAAAETFIKQRIRGKYRDLIALIEFGDQAYVVTPFTNDYDNILLSLSLIGDWTEFQKFPDTGTTIGAALDEAVRLFRSFYFLNASGNLILIFSDGQDSDVSSRGVTVSQLLRGAAQAKIPIFFIRVAYNRHEGDIIPDPLWRSAVESTGGRFFAGSDENSILRAISEIDRFGAGSIQVKQYRSSQPRYASFTLFAAVFWLGAAALKIIVPYFQKFP